MSAPHKKTKTGYWYHVVLRRDHGLDSYVGTIFLGETAVYHTQAMSEKGARNQVLVYFNTKLKPRF